MLPSHLAAAMAQPSLRPPPCDTDTSTPDSARSPADSVQRLVDHEDAHEITEAACSSVFEAASAALSAAADAGSAASRQPPAELQLPVPRLPHGNSASLIRWQAEHHELGRRPCQFPCLDFHVMNEAGVPEATAKAEFAFMAKFRVASMCGRQPSRRESVTSRLKGFTVEDNMGEGESETANDALTKLISGPSTYMCFVDLRRRPQPWGSSGIFFRLLKDELVLEGACKEADHICGSGDVLVAVSVHPGLWRRQWHTSLSWPVPPLPWPCIPAAGVGTGRRGRVAGAAIAVRGGTGSCCTTSATSVNRISHGTGGGGPGGAGNGVSGGGAKTRRNGGGGGGDDDGGGPGSAGNGVGGGFGAGSGVAGTSDRGGAGAGANGGAGAGGGGGGEEGSNGAGNGGGGSGGGREGNDGGGGGDGDDPHDGDDGNSGGEEFLRDILRSCWCRSLSDPQYSHLPQQVNQDRPCSHSTAVLNAAIGKSQEEVMSGILAGGAAAFFQ